MSKLRILVVDDAFVNRMVLASMARRVDARVDEVENGLQAVEALHRHGYDLVLMDVMMPVMDGIEATKKIRTSKELTTQPMIVAITVNDDASNKKACLAAGMDEFLVKPLRFEQFLGVISRFYARVAPETAAEQSQDGPLLFNPLSLLRKVGGDPGIASLIVRDFLEKHEQAMNELDSALEQRDFKLLRIHAMSLSSLLFYFSQPLAAMTGELGACAKSGGTEELRAIFSRLRRDLDGILPELRRFIEEFK